MWVGGVADSQTRPKPLKKNQIAPKIVFFDPNFTFRFPKSHKNPGVGGWVNRFEKNGFFLAASLTSNYKVCPPVKIKISMINATQANAIINS